MEFISQKEFDAFINSLGNGVESSEISDFQNLFAQQNDFSSSVLAQSQSPFNDQKRDTVSNVPYPAIASPLPTLPNIQGHHALANSLDFDLIQANPVQQVIPNLDTQNYIQPYPTPSAAYANELFGNSDVSSPDHSLSDSNYAYSSSGPSSPDSNAISNAPSSPEVQYISSKQNFNQPPFTPMFGVPANYGMDEQRAYDSSSPQMRKPFVKQEKTDLMEELEARVGWANSEGKDDKSRKKPRDNSKESQQEKHKSAEKQRRSNMNELLERLKTLLPNAHTAEVQKMTKLNILAETVDYVVKLQDLCKELIQENKQLKGQLERGSLNVPSAVPAAGPVAIGRKVASTQPSMIEDGASKKRKLGIVAGVQQYVMDGSRAIFLSVFFLMVIFSPYADHSHGISEAFEASGQPRVVLNDGPQTVIPPSVASGMLAFTSLPFLTAFLFNFLKWGVLVIAGFAFMVWGDRSISTKSPNFALAKEEMEIAHVQILSGQFSEVEDRCRKALELLDRVPPRSYFMALLLTVYQLWRHIMHRFLIGIYIEQIIAGLKGTEKEYADLVADVCSLLLKSWYKAPPNVEWLYICLDAINTARVFVPHKVIGLTASSTFRIRGNTGMAFRMWEIYIDWGLRSLKDSLVDTSLEQKHLFYSAEGCKHLVQGELVQAKASFKKSLDISSLIEDEKLRFFIELKTVGMFGMMFMLEQRWEEAMQAYKVVTKHAETRSHKAGLYWGVVGLCTSLVHLKQVEKAKFVRKYFMAKYPNFLSASENPAVPFLAFDMDLAEGKYIKAMEKAEIIVKNIKETSAYCTVHSMTHFLVFGESVLALWEESLAETSSLRTHSSKLSRMSHETCTVVYKVACANPVMQPRALILKGQYYFLLKNYAKAKYYWTNAVETARKLQMTADEKVAIERLSNSQLEIKDDCHHKACIEKLVSTLTQQ